MHGAKRRLGLAAGGILVLVLSGCGGDTGVGSTPSAVAKDHLKILVGGMSKQIYLPNMLTKQLGYFDEQNLDVELIDEASG
jgi:NitT/TauT family transport system substrate-binding protein